MPNPLRAIDIPHSKFGFNWSNCPASFEKLKLSFVEIGRNIKEARQMFGTRLFPLREKPRVFDRLSWPTTLEELPHDMMKLWLIKHWASHELHQARCFTLEEIDSYTSNLAIDTKCERMMTVFTVEEVVDYVEAYQETLQEREPLCRFLSVLVDIALSGGGIKDGRGTYHEEAVLRVSPNYTSDVLAGLFGSAHRAFLEELLLMRIKDEGYEYIHLLHYARERIPPPVMREASKKI